MTVEDRQREMFGEFYLGPITDFEVIEPSPYVMMEKNILILYLKPTADYDTYEHNRSDCTI